MTTQATDRTAMRERLIAIAEQWVCSRCSEGTPTGLADAILAEFPEIGQPPQVTLHVPASDLPPNFTPSDTHIRAGLVDIGQQPRLDPALRERIARKIDELGNLIATFSGQDDYPNTMTADTYAAKHEGMRTALMALIDSIAPAAQPQIDREALAQEMRKAAGGSIEDWYVLEREIKDRWYRAGDAAIAHLNAAPAAQPLPTRSEFQDVIDRYATHCVGTVTPFILDDLVTAGFAREDEPEPPVDAWEQKLSEDGMFSDDTVLHNSYLTPSEDDEPEPQVGEVAYTPEAERLGEAVLDSYYYVTNTPVLWDELDSIEKEKWAYVGQYMIDNHALALAKAVADRGGS